LDPYYIIIVAHPPEWSRVNIDAFRNALNLSAGWIKGAGFSWLVKTTNPVQVWYRRLESIFPDESELYIGKIDLLEMTGLLSKAAWDWIRSETAPVSVASPRASKPNS
jgi:hypothetical protein